MAKSFTLDGKRYRFNPALPLATLDYIVRFLHVSTSDEEVKAIVRRRALDAPRRADWPERLIVQAERYALSRHRANQRLFRYVQRGG